MARGHPRDLCGANDNAHRRRGPLRGTPARGPATDGHHEGGRPNLAHAWRRATGGGTAISRRRRRLFSAVARHEIAAPGARRRVRGPRWVEDDDACARRPCTRSGSAAGPGRPLFAARPAAPWGTPARSRARLAAMGRVRRPRARHWATGTTYAACARAASAEGAACVRAAARRARRVATQESGLHYLVLLVQLRLLAAGAAASPCCTCGRTPRAARRGPRASLLVGEMRGGPQLKRLERRELEPLPVGEMREEILNARATRARAPQLLGGLLVHESSSTTLEMASSPVNLRSESNWLL